MRIVNFPKFIVEEETKQHCLRNCSLVIDGLNFFYHTYEQSRLRYEFGSEANEYSKYLMKTKLAQFKKANVKCYFVFKGGDIDMKDKIQKYDGANFNFDSNYKYFVPVFMRDVYLQLLREMGFSFATSVAGYKNDCVALAHLLGCPILSDDIEYCFRTVTYIPYTSIRYNSSNNYITCRQYERKNFLNKHLLSNRKVAIFAALSNTKIFPLHHFDDLLQTWGVYNEEGNLYVQNKELLKWLSGHSEEEATNHVSEFLSNQIETKRFLNCIENVLEIMENNCKGIVTDYLYNNCKLSLSRCDPLWFEKGVAAQYIAIPYINLYKFKNIRGSRAIESKHSTDSIMLSIGIIKYAYNLLTNFQNTDITVYQDADNCIEINTEDFNVRKPKYKCNKSVFEHGWGDIKRLKLFEHFLNENIISTAMINKLPVDGRVLFIALTYFARMKRSVSVGVTKEVYSFIICYVTLQVASRSHSMKNKGILGRDDDAEALRATDKYFKCEEQEARLIFDGDALKTLVELQYCLLHMNYLKTLCGAPYPTTKYHRTFNGTFIYKVFRDMDENNEDEFIEALFGTAPTVLQYINMLTRTYKQLINVIEIN